MSFDFIEKNGKYYVIECNPRATSGAHLLANNLAEIFFDAQLIEKPKFLAKGLKLPILINKPSLIFSKSFHSIRDVLFDSNDMMPMFMQVISIFEIIILAWREKLSLLEATTYDIEWNGEKALNK